MRLSRTRCEFFRLIACTVCLGAGKVNGELRYEGRVTSKGEKI